MPLNVHRQPPGAGDPAAVQSAHRVVPNTVAVIAICRNALMLCTDALHERWRVAGERGPVLLVDHRELGAPGVQQSAPTGRVRPAAGRALAVARSRLLERLGGGHPGR